ncbi:MAG: hypothetical protein IPL60_01975 [Ardenticatenia bacterium]|nr:hypothetical protein [Ardenticatenia bacterium]
MSDGVQQGVEAGRILVEVTSAGLDDDYDGEVMRGFGSRVKDFSTAEIAGALAVVRVLAGQTRAMVADMQAAPGHDDLSGVEVEFGLKFNSELQAYVAKASGEASMTIKLSWAPEKR